MDAVTLTYGPHTPADLGDVLALYAAAYAGPPWYETAADVAAFRERYAVATGRATFRAAVARREGALVGMCLGHADELPAGDPFGDLLRAELPAGTVERHLTGAVALMELMVFPAAHGQGVGSALLRTFLTTCDRAWLATHRPDGPIALYERYGFTRVGDLTSRPLTIMAAERSGQRAPAST